VKFSHCRKYREIPDIREAYFPLFLVFLPVLELNRNNKGKQTYPIAAYVVVWAG
jgi:hypothetical protein